MLCEYSSGHKVRVSGCKIWGFPVYWSTFAQTFQQALCEEIQHEGKALPSRAASRENESGGSILEKKQTVPNREGFREEATLRRL